MQSRLFSYPRKKMLIQKNLIFPSDERIQILQDERISIKAKK